MFFRGCPLVVIFLTVGHSLARAQSPEILLREFASGQIKKGVRSIGMGGNGATWGNYSLTWRDSSTALLNVGVSSYSNQNNFSFTGVGVNSPRLGRNWVLYAIALSQNANNIGMSLSSPALGNAPAPVHGDGSNQAIFIKAARPFQNGWSFGFLLSYERSQFGVVSDATANFVRFQTSWLPSGGLGLTWQPTNSLLIGFRGLFNQDRERKIDNLGTYQGLNLAHEYRLGFSLAVWKGALIDLGGNFRYRFNEIANAKSTNLSPNVGFEQNFWRRRFALRCGLDENSATGGLSLRALPLILDVAYLNNLGSARIGQLYGASSNSVIATLAYNYSFQRK